MRQSSDALAALDASLERPAALPVLSDDGVHLWHASLDVPAQRVQHLACTLSEDERARAGRFIFERDYRRFITARGLLRLMLAHYLTCEPDRVSFRYDACGKPELVQAPGEDKLHFSVSHTFELAVFAFTRSRRIGIDAERVRGIPEAEAIVQETFSPREQAIWYALPDDQQQEAFFHGWTRKEAYLKAIGVGLAWPLNCIEVTLEPGEPARLLCVNGDPQLASRWSLVALYSAAGYVGALAVEGRDWHLKCCVDCNAPKPSRREQQKSERIALDLP